MGHLEGATPGAEDSLHQSLRTLRRATWLELVESPGLSLSKAEACLFRPCREARGGPLTKRERLRLPYKRRHPSTSPVSFPKQPD